MPVGSTGAFVLGVAASGSEGAGTALVASGVADVVSTADGASERIELEGAGSEDS